MLYHCNLLMMADLHFQMQSFVATGGQAKRIQKRKFERNAQDILFAALGFGTGFTVPVGSLEQFDQICRKSGQI